MSEAEKETDQITENDLLEMLNKAKAEFNNDRRLIIKNLPHDTHEKSVRAFMGFNGEFPVEVVQMCKNANQALVTLKDPSLVEEAISKLNETQFMDQTVSVSVYHSEQILCVAHLPDSFSEKTFRDLVEEHGNIKMCFLMRSEHTGESKGYGFVEYNEPIDKVGQIKLALDWSTIEDQTIHCDALVDNTQTGITFEDLHSKCLLIDNLPADYTDSIALRELFSELVKPVYCQIVTKENVSLGFGIVEYDNAEDAERAYNKFNKSEINEEKIRINYCLPGKSAVHMFNRIMFKFGDKVHVNKASLLPDPVYPNPAFLKHNFFKMHFAKHPRMLVQFTDNLLHLQEGYVRQLEDRTNTKPGLLGPAPTIPMSPLMDVNLQLGLLSLIVLDMRETGTYNGTVPDPLGKLKIPSEDDFNQKPEPVSLLGDPMTAQANIILKNLLMPPDNPDFQPRGGKCGEDAPRLLGKPIGELNLVYMCSLGRMMAMLSENTQNMGLLGSGPSGPPKPTGPPKPLLDGLMQAGKVAQSLLSSMGLSAQGKGLNNQPLVQGQFSQQSQKSLLGEPPNMSRINSSNMQSGLMNNLQALQKLQGQGNNNSKISTKGDGLLGNYQGQSQPNQIPPLLSKAVPLMSLNLNNKGEGLIPTPDLGGEGCFQGNQGNYDDSGYQGGYDEENDYGHYDNTGSYGNQGYDGGMNGNYGNQGSLQGNMAANMAANRRNNAGGIKSLMSQDMTQNNDSQRFDGAYFSGINKRQKLGIGQQPFQKTGAAMKGDSQYISMAEKAAMFAAGAAAAYKQQYEAYYGSQAGQGSQSYHNAQNAHGSYGSGQQGSYSGNYGDGAYNSYQDSSQTSLAMNNHTGQYGNKEVSQASWQAAMTPNVRGASSLTSSNTNNNGSSGGNIPSLFAQPVQPSGPSTYGAIGQSRGTSRQATGTNNRTAQQWGSAAGFSATSTPQGQKRSFPLPSPEPSPEGDYVGQHSQGIGGHYADSYLPKRQKLMGRFT